MDLTQGELRTVLSCYNSKQCMSTYWRALHNTGRVKKMRYFRIVSTVSKEFEDIIEDMIKTHNEIKDSDCWLGVFSRLNLKNKKMSDKFLWYPSWLEPAIYDVRQESGRWLLDIGSTLAGNDKNFRGNAEFIGTFCDDILSISETEKFVLELHGETKCGNTIAEDIDFEYEKGKVLTIENKHRLELRQITKPFEMELTLVPEESVKTDMEKRLEKTRAYYSKWKREEEYLPMLFMDWLRALATPIDVFEDEVTGEYLSELSAPESDEEFVEFEPLGIQGYKNTVMGPFMDIECWDGEQIRISALSLTEPIIDRILNDIEDNNHMIVCNKKYIAY